MSAAPEELVEVEDLDAADVLALADTNEREIRAREALRLRLAYQWAVLHPAEPEPVTGVLDAEELLGGDGCPAVAAFTTEPFALSLGMSSAAGAQLVADALDLRHRHPLLWRRVQALVVPAWQARRVACQTHRLPLAGARWVDDQLAARVDGACGPVITDRLVAAAAAEFDPETHQDREDQAQAGWDVTLNHPGPADFAGTSWLSATGDTLTLTEFQELVIQIAHQLHLDGDTSPLGVRKVKALRVITLAARGEGTLTTTTSAAGKVHVIVRVDAADLEVDATGEPVHAAGQVEKLGAATVARIRAWVGHHQVVIRPVLNLHRRDAVDQHDPPAWMRDLVVLRDQHCVFPRCTVDARSCDLDHQTPYRDPADGGQPGQTTPDNLAALCRRHHRAKTHGAWRYHGTPERGYLWHGPHGATYLVTDRGTERM